MTLYTVTGRTFDHRDLLKAWRGRFDMESKAWTVDLSAPQVATLRAKPGVVVTEARRDPEPSLSYRERLSNIIQQLEREEVATAAHRDGKSAIYGDDPRWFNYFRDQNPTAFFGFSSLATFVRYVASLRDPGAGRNAGWRPEKRDGWYGTDDLPAALALARDGWHEGVDLAESLDVPPAVVRRRRYSVAGGSVNVGRMLAGHPAHMRSRPRQPGRRVVTLFVETFMSAGIDPDNAVIRAALIARIADAMEREGYSCEIVAIVTTRGAFGGGGTGHQHAITLKQAGERLALPDIVFALGHPSFFRRLVFASVGAADECGSTHSTQGSPTDAFSTDHPTARNEFYIRKLTIGQQRQIDEDDPYSMLQFIEPVDLPVSLRSKLNG